MKYFLNAPYWVKCFAINIYGFFLYKRRFNTVYKSFKNKIDNNLQKTKREILSEQFVLLKNNLIFCYEKIPYYKHLFEKVEFNPYTFSSEEEIKKIPYLTKDIIRDNYNDLINPSIPKSKYITHYTSGSTGERLEFLIPKKLRYSLNAAFLYRFYSFLGIREGDRRATIGGRRFTNTAPFWIYNYFENQLLMSSHHLNDQNKEKYLKKLNEFKPVFIQGHPSSILVLAKFIKDFRVKLKFNLKGIFTTGETLIEDDRKIIETSFNTIVLQQYGSGENAFSAQESPTKKGYLLNYEHGYVELIGKDKLKQVVVTSYLNDVMPFVRYKIGDYAIASNCYETKKYPLPVKFKEIVGRIDDIIFSSKGSVIVPVTVRMLLKPFLFSGTNYQLIQDNSIRFTLNLVDIDYRIDVDSLKSELIKLLGEEVKISVKYKKHLLTKGGKIRNVINNYKALS